MQFEYTIIECHRMLIMLMHEEMEDVPERAYINRCLWLLNFILSSSVPINGEILKLLEEVINNFGLWCNVLNEGCRIIISVVDQQFINGNVITRGYFPWMNEEHAAVGCCV